MTPPSELRALLPCPFCGGEAYLRFSHESGRYDCYEAGCDACDIGRMGELATTTALAKESAANLWNQRNNASALLDEIEGLREALTPSGDTKAAYMGEFSFPVCHMTPPSELRALLPCPNPWCHPSDTLFPVLHWDGMAALVECNSCGMQGPSFSPVEFNDDGEEIGTRDAEAEAVQAWNTRNNASALMDRIAELEAENDRLARAVVGGTLPGLLEDEEQVALVDFIKFLRSQSPSQGDAS